MKYVLLTIVLVARTATADPRDTCELHVTGGAKVNIAASNPRGAHADAASAFTDYWMTDDDLRARLTEMQQVIAKRKAEAPSTRSVDDAMKKDPRLVLLQIRCGDDAGALELLPGPRSRYADVPFAPAKYKLVARPAAKAGQFTATFSLGQGATFESFAIDGAGTLELTQFDTGGIAGSVHFTAKGRKGKTITVDGRFDFGCTGGHRCK
jgi:hypothetical protein